MSGQGIWPSGKEDNRCHDWSFVGSDGANLWWLFFPPKSWYLQIYPEGVGGGGDTCGTNSNANSLLTLYGSNFEGFFFNHVHMIPNTLNVG